ncbi:MAG TPA: phosphohistidine phosphatase SixA [Blastocatellia bacterium]|nr:phosphohistidine phosphatase SixA [Blastocatellia bacterium]
MELYIIRHAIAEPLGQENDFLDEKRALTSEGRDRMRESIKGLRKLGVEFDLILTSPLVRAVETAEIIASAFGLTKKDVEQTVNLAPGASFDELFAEIKKRTGVESIALVGHQPDLGNLISTIVTGGEGLSVQLKKGSVCAIRVSETVPTIRGELIYLLMPKQLRLLAKA